MVLHTKSARNAGMLWNEFFVFQRGCWHIGLGKRSIFRPTLAASRRCSRHGRQQRYPNRKRPRGTCFLWGQLLKMDLRVEMRLTPDATPHARATPFAA